MVQFIHAADLHIDSPLKSLQQYEGAPVGLLLDATRNALVRIVEVAIERSVDFVVIAGDLFDGPWSDMQTGAWTAVQFRRLETAEIPVYLLQGNHDAESRVERHTNWPANVRTFPVDKPTTFRIEKHHVALHGQGFAHREVTENLAANYPPAIADHINIGVLHTCLGGHPRHSSYAPCTVETLVDRGYDYWALGHIHQRDVIHESPRIIFSGNTQGRSIRETGTKGCYLVQIDDNRVSQVEFIATDSIRWQSLPISLEADDDCAILMDRVRQKLQQQAGEDSKIGSAVRIVVTGASAAHAQLTEFAEADRMIAEIRNLANALAGNVWVEKVQLRTSPVADLNQIRQQRDLLGQLFRDFSKVADDDDALRELAGVFRPIVKSHAIALDDAAIGMQSSHQIRTWLSAAESLLATHLAEAE